MAKFAKVTENECIIDEHVRAIYRVGQKSEASAYFGLYLLNTLIKCHNFGTL